MLETAAAASIYSCGLPRVLNPVPRIQICFWILDRHYTIGNDQMLHPGGRWWRVWLWHHHPKIIHSDISPEKYRISTISWEKFPSNLECLGFWNCRWKVVICVALLNPVVIPWYRNCYYFLCHEELTQRDGWLFPELCGGLSRPSNVLPDRNVCVYLGNLATGEPNSVTDDGGFGCCSQFWLLEDLIAQSGSLTLYGAGIMGSEDQSCRNHMIKPQ